MFYSLTLLVQVANTLNRGTPCLTHSFRSICPGSSVLRHFCKTWWTVSGFVSISVSCMMQSGVPLPCRAKVIWLAKTGFRSFRTLNICNGRNESKKKLQIWWSEKVSCYKGYLPAPGCLREQGVAANLVSVQSISDVRCLPEWSVGDKTAQP